MKNLIMLIVLMMVFVLSSVSFAQNNESYDSSADIELLKTDLKAQKISLVKDGMELTKEEGKKFWPIYNEYQEEVGKLIDLKVKLIKDYAEHYEKMTDKKAEDLLDEAIDIDEKSAKLQKKYIKKIKKVLPAKKVVRFYQLDNRITMLLQLQTSANIPLIK
jgi:hypothetical protein